MGAYISQTDIENRFGTSTVAKWSQLEETTEAADTSRIATAIAWAEEFVENRFRGTRYAVPFTGTSKMLVDWCAVHAGVWLYSNRGSSAGAESADADRFNSMAVNANNEMQACLNGAMKLPLGLARATPTVPVVVR